MPLAMERPLVTVRACFVQLQEGKTRMQKISQKWLLWRDFAYIRAAEKENLA